MWPKIIILLALIAIVSAFRSPMTQLPKIKSPTPLQTAKLEFIGIPRLEPGLRLIRTPKYLLSDAIALENAIPISSIALNLLGPSSSTPPTAAALAIQQANALLNIPINSLFTSAKSNFNNFGVKFVNYLKKLMVASMVFASSSMPTSNLHVRRAAAMAGMTLSAITAGPKIVARATMFKKYQQLSATQKLATTPLYFVSNSRGNAYLQDDVQVQDLDFFNPRAAA